MIGVLIVFRQRASILWKCLKSAVELAYLRGALAAIELRTPGLCLLQLKLGVDCFVSAKEALEPKGFRNTFLDE